MVVKALVIVFYCVDGRGHEGQRGGNSILVRGDHLSAVDYWVMNCEAGVGGGTRATPLKTMLEVRGGGSSRLSTRRKYRAGSRMDDGVRKDGKILSDLSKEGQ